MFFEYFLKQAYKLKSEKNIFIYVLLKNRKWHWKYFTQYKKKLRKSDNNYFVNQKGLLTLIRMGFSAVLFLVRFGRGKITLFLKPVSIMLEAWNLIRKYTHTFSFRKYTLQFQKFLHFADVNIFLQKISILAKLEPSLKAIVRELY